VPRRLDTPAHQLGGGRNEGRKACLTMRLAAACVILIGATLVPRGLVSSATAAERPAAADVRSARQGDAVPENPVDKSAPAADPVAGFRTAHFGMTEPDVRKAIERDFGAKSHAIKAEINRAERTHVLTVRVPDLLPGGGRAVVAYVFGYKTNKLIQVGVTWSKETDPGITPEMLYANADILKEYFLQAGYNPASITTNMAVPNGVLIFRGSDRDGHETVLLLLGTVQKGKDQQRVLAPTTLNRIYVANPKDPDIYRLPKGDF
jgi:hypothetical protein